MAVACTWDSGTITAGRYGSASCTGIVTPTLYDILALHKVGDGAADFLAWAFVNGQPTAPLPMTPPGQHNASRGFAIPTSGVGSYTVRLISGLNGTQLAESATFTINAYDNAIVISGPASQSINTTLTATYSGIPTSLANTGLLRIGLFFSPGSEYSSPRVDAAIPAGSTSGTIPLFIPNNTITGTYKLRVTFSGIEQYPNWYVESADITITNTSAVTLTRASSTANAGTDVNVTWANIVNPSADDWVGLFTIGAASTAPTAWAHTNGLATGTMPFRIPQDAATATYEFRIYRAITNELMATSSSIAVTAVAYAPPPTLPPTSFGS